VKIMSVGFQTPATVVLCLLIGGAGSMVLGIQPIFLSELLNDHIITTVELGWIATAEVLTIAIGLLVGTRVLGNPSARWLVLASGVIMALANYGTWIAGTMLTALVSRLIAGMAEGMFMAVSVLCITYGNAPSRLNAAFLAIAAAIQVAGAYYMPRFGASVGYAAMAFIGLAGGAMAVAIKQPFAPITREERHRIKWTLLVVLSLSGTVLSSAAIGAAWSYVEALGLELGFHSEQIGGAIMSYNALQIVATLIIMAIGYRLPFLFVLLFGTALHCATIVLLMNSHNFWTFFAALSTFGFLWCSCVPFTTDLIISVDESRVTAPLLLPLLFIGLSVGSLAASFFVGASVVGAFHVSIVLFMFSIACYALIFLLKGKDFPVSDIRTSTVVETLGK
jgi:DHA1 family inner membrane transport protein